MNRNVQKQGIRSRILIFVSLFSLLFSWSYAQESNHLYAKVKRLEGQGNGGVWLNLTEATRDNIMAGAPWKVQQPEYDNGTSPILVRVSNPANLKGYDYRLVIAPTASSLDNSLIDPAAHWTLTWYQNGTQLGSYTSQHSIGEGVEEEISGHGIAITVKNAPFVIHDEQLANYVSGNGGYTFRNNSWYAQPDLIGSALSYNGSVHWLGGLQDSYTSTPDNWIRAGHRTAVSRWECSSVQAGAECDYSLWRTEDFFNPYNSGNELTRGFMDYYGQFGHIAGGLWAPYVLSSPYDGGPKAKFLSEDVLFGEYPPTPYYFDFKALTGMPNRTSYNQTLTNLYSVDIVLTPDQSQWTRALVLEAGSGNSEDKKVTQHFNGQTYQNIRHEPKNCPSVDKNGNPDNSGTTGYGWFPGYAINVETGERLNIMFAENSEDEYNHGNDMIFNPTNVFAFQKDADGNYVLDANGQPIPMTLEEYNTLYSSFYDHTALGEPLYGGRHYVYICSSSGNSSNLFYIDANRQRNFNDNGTTIGVMGYTHGGTFTGTDGVAYPYYECGVYDEGKWLGEKFKTLTETDLSNNTRKAKKMQVFNNVMYTSIPMPAVGQESNWLANDAIINIRVTRPYMFYTSAVGTGPDNVTNNNAPAFSFNTSNLDVPHEYNLYSMTNEVLDDDNRLNVNNVDAPFKPQGGAWFFDESSDYHVPRGTDKTSYFCYSFWMGAQSADGMLHLFADRFNQVGIDTWPGPLSTVNASVDEATKLQWSRTFKITRQEVLEFLANYQTPGYVIPHHILDWPAHGDTTKGQAWLLAPFTDVDGDGVYNPAHGDHPDFPGDMAQFLIFNDNYGPHTESQGSPMGVEVHVLAYAYDAPDDSIMNNTIFLKYKIINRSATSYDSAYIGMWSDWDVGYANDDFVGCDVMKSTAYCYNGSDFDGSGQSWSYGENWPIQTLTLISGPLLPADGLDNPAYTAGGDCTQFMNGLNQYAINGTGFGDGIVDNERYGLTGFVFHNNDNSVVGDPTMAVEYYNYMRGIWRDGTHVKYGGNGHPSNGGNGPDCKFMFPGLSDPCNWGTGGVDPNTAQYGPGGWTEPNVGNAPYDRRGLATVGPFSLAAGSMQEIELSLVTLPHSYAVNQDGSITLDSLSHVNPNYRSQQFLPAVLVELNESICEGETYTFHGSTYSETGTYRCYVHNAAYSNDIPDTIFTLNLTVVPIYTLIYAAVLPGSGYHENGFDVSSGATSVPGTYIFTKPATTVSGCSNMLVLCLDVRTDVGVEEHVTATHPVIYPNPTTGVVYVEFSEEWASEVRNSLTVYDIHGKLLQSMPVMEMRSRIDLSAYPAGFYLIKVGDFVGKVVKK